MQWFFLRGNTSRVGQPWLKLWRFKIAYSKKILCWNAYIDGQNRPLWMKWHLQFPTPNFFYHTVVPFLLATLGTNVLREWVHSRDYMVISRFILKYTLCLHMISIFTTFYIQYNLLVCIHEFEYNVRTKLHWVYFWGFAKAYSPVT